MVKLPYNLGSSVRDSITKYRRKNNIPDPQELKKVYNKNMQFLDEELSLVKEITIDNTSLEYIALFPNVSSVVISGSNEISQTGIKEVINAFPNLEKLSIYGQDGLQYLDVSSLTKLKDLQIVSNRGLNRVVGIDKLENLSNFVFYDNQVYKTISELCNTVAVLSKKGIRCDLDVLYMPNILKSNFDFDEANLKWSEAVGLGENKNQLQYDSHDLRKAYEKAQEIVNSYTKSTDTPIQKYAILYQWMCENIRYDDDAIDNNYTHTSDDKNEGLVGGTNGTVNGLVYGHCICEGYSKSMQMLLKLCDISSFDIGCYTGNQTLSIPMIDISGKKKTNIGDHSIIKVNLDGKIYYSDITWDTNRFQNSKDRRYFLLSKEDIEKSHKLIGEDRVFLAFKSVSIDEQQQLLEYARSRINAVNEEKKKQSFKQKDSTEIIAEVNKDLISIRQEYEVIATKIENLMAQNQKMPMPNYERELTLLINQRDGISNKMGQLNSYQLTLQDNINYDKKQKLNSLLFQVERLLGFHITATDSYVVDPQKFNGIPQVVPKNTMVLAKEQGLVARELDDLWFSGELDLKTVNELKSAIRMKYQQMISKAPKPKKTSPVDFQNKEQPTRPIISDTADDALDDDTEVEMINTNSKKLNRPIIRRNIIEEKLKKSSEQLFTQPDQVSKTAVPTETESAVSKELDLLKTAKIDVLEIQRQMELNRQNNILGINTDNIEYEEDQDAGMSM